MKKLILYIIITAVFFAGCSSRIDENKKTDIVAFPKTTWRMRPNEVLNAYQLTKEDVEYEENKDVIYITIPNLKLFDIATEGVSFEFLKTKKENFQLYNVWVSYPDNQDMNEVLKQLKKEYGAEADSYPNYMGELGKKKTKRTNIKATKHKKYFLSSKTLKSQLSDKQEEELYTILGTRFSNKKDWNEFLTVSPVSMLTWTDDFSYDNSLQSSIKTK